MLSLEEISIILEKMVEYAKYTKNPTINITWHGGEPLLYGVEKFRKIIVI